MKFKHNKDGIWVFFFFHIHVMEVVDRLLSFLSIYLYFHASVYFDFQWTNIKYKYAQIDRMEETIVVYF